MQMCERKGLRTATHLQRARTCTEKKGGVWQCGTYQNPWWRKKKKEKKSRLLQTEERGGQEVAVCCWCLLGGGRVLSSTSPAPIEANQCRVSVGVGRCPIKTAPTKPPS